MDESGNCKEVSELLSIAMDRELTRDEQKRLMQHFRVCTWCHDHRSQLELVCKTGRNLDTLCDDDESEICLPDSARDRIKHALRDQTPPGSDEPSPS